MKSERMDGGAIILRPESQEELDFLGGFEERIRLGRIVVITTEPMRGAVLIGDFKDPKVKAYNRAMVRIKTGGR